MDGWVGHVAWPIADGLTTERSPVQLAVWRRIGKVRRPRRAFYPLCYAANWVFWCCRLGGRKSNRDCKTQRSYADDGDLTWARCRWLFLTYFLGYTAAQSIVIGPVCVCVCVWWAGGRCPNLTTSSARAVFASVWALFFISSCCHHCHSRYLLPQ